MFGSKRALIRLQIAAERRKNRGSIAVRDQIIKKNKCGTTGRVEEVEIWRSYGLWHRSLLSKSHHKPYVRHLCKKRVKVYLKEPKNKFQ